MCKSLLYLNNGSGDVATLNLPIPLGDVIRKYGCAIKANANTIRITEPGYYNVDITTIITAGTAGNVTLTLYQDGIPVTGGIAVETITTANTEVKTLSTHSVIRVYCGKEISTLNVIPTGTAPTIIDFTVRVEKV